MKERKKPMKAGNAILVTCVFALAVPSFDGLGGEGSFRFRDVGDERGLFPGLSGIRGHGAAWGDVNGDGWPELYVGTFYKPSSGANRLFYHEGRRFRLDGQKSLKLKARTSGVLFVDLDNDGDLDLYVSSMPSLPGSELAERVGSPLAGTSLFRNEGDGQFVDISKGNGACPEAFGGRSAAVLDFDGDGLLDLLVGEDPNPGYNGSKTHSSRLFRNRGDLEFEDVTQQVGIPAGIPGLGVAAADVNNDGWPDFFLACQGEGNRLFINNRAGRFQEAPDSHALFVRWKGIEKDGDNMVCGVSFGDVNRDGRLDIVLGQHYARPWLEPVANRLYVNRGIEDGMPRFEDVTEQVGLMSLPMKSPHVEIRDFDNDGWPDLYASIVTFAKGQPHPLIFKHLGLEHGLPQFRQEALAVNDFPTAKDRSVKRTGEFFAKMVQERKIIYMAPGPSCDFDRDGRLDLFLPNWWPESRSLLLRNETQAGNWLRVQVEGGEGINRMGVGSKVNIYRGGEFNRADALLGCQEISVGYGYCSGHEAVVHFGLGDRTRVDVEVILPHGKGKLVRKRVNANQTVTLRMQK